MYNEVMAGLRKIWLSRAGRLLIAYLALDVVIMIYTGTAGAKLNAGHDTLRGQLVWTAGDTVLCWLAWRGGRLGAVAWVLLVAEVLITLPILLAGMLSFTPYICGLLVILILQGAALLAPPVRHHVLGRSRAPA
jgi:hypothetical protein